MASAFKRFKQETKLVATRVEVPDGVVLSLSASEAQTLADILGKIGGDPHTSRRGIAAKIGEAMQAAGYYFQFPAVWCTGSITFIDGK